MTAKYVALYQQILIGLSSWIINSCPNDKKPNDTFSFLPRLIQGIVESPFCVIATQAGGLYPLTKYYKVFTTVI